MEKMLTPDLNTQHFVSNSKVLKALSNRNIKYTYGEYLKFSIQDITHIDRNIEFLKKETSHNYLKASYN